MGALMEKAGCSCALPEYCFTNYLEPGYKDSDIPVEICESVVEVKKETGELRFRTLPGIQAACVFHKGSYRTFSESYETHGFFEKSSPMSGMSLGGLRFPTSATADEAGNTIWGILFVFGTQVFYA
ncbi:MAG: hypothetical protein ACI4P4_17120 [Faecousia sp.]